MVDGVAVVAGTAAAAALVALPLRLTLNSVPPTTALDASAAAGTGLYLRSLDVWRTRSVAEARRAQRLDLARDLHDFVAHEIGGVIVQTQAPGGPDCGRWPRWTGSSRCLTTTLPGTARTAWTSCPDFSTASVGRAPAGLGLEISAGEVPPGVSATAYRVVVEALTNVRRQAPDATAAVAPARRLRPDVVIADINATSTSTKGRCGINAPFGDYRNSGNGRERGAHGSEEYLDTNAILGQGD
ncbi:hypothetical protein AB0L25_39080 [Spirillospora sp. NPDC052242]